MKRSICASGKRIGALLFQRILSRQHQEGVGQRVGLVADGDLAFLHGFQQRALHLGRRAIDLVRENEIAENRPVLGAKGAVLGVVDHGADNVGRQHVGRKLQALEVHVDAGGQGFERQGLGEARHAFQQDVAVGEQRDQQPVEQVLLADDDARHLRLQRLDPGGILQHGLARGAHRRVGFDRHRTHFRHSRSFLNHGPKILLDWLVQSLLATTLGW